MYGQKFCTICGEIYLSTFFLRTSLTAEVFLNHSGFLDHIQLTHTVGLLWTSDQPVVEASTYTGQYNVETQETNIHVLSAIRTRDPSNQAAADLRLRPRGHLNRHLSTFQQKLAQQYQAFARFLFEISSAARFINVIYSSSVKIA
jgi:hypothetical protein